jgi:hypothetical protein
VRHPVIGVESFYGSVSLYYWFDQIASPAVSTTFASNQNEYWQSLSLHILPGAEAFEAVDGARIWCPLWLLAFLCLVWPVTSFIIARRRHKRGFPVDQVATDSIASGAPKGHPQREPGASPRVGGDA